MSTHQLTTQILVTLGFIVVLLMMIRIAFTWAELFEGGAQGRVTIPAWVITCVALTGLITGDPSLSVVNLWGFLPWPIFVSFILAILPITSRVAFAASVAIITGGMYTIVLFWSC